MRLIPIYSYKSSVQHPPVMNCLSHKVDDNNFCILCGLEVQSSCDLVGEYKTSYPSYPPPSKHHKYTVRHFKQLDLLDLVFGYLNKLEYKPIVLEDLRNRSFVSRLSLLDKALLSLFHSLKRDGCPVFFSDLSKFTKSNLQSKYFKEFKRRGEDRKGDHNNYLLNVYNRFTVLFKTSPSCGPPFERLRQLRDSFVNTKIEILTIAFFLEGRDLEKSYEEYSLRELCTLRQLKRVREGVKRVSEGGSEGEHRKVDREEHRKVGRKNVKDSITKGIKEIQRIMDL